jgi:hypothetical protein
MKERKGWEISEKKGGRRETAVMREEDFSLCLGSKSEPEKSCCCPLLSKLQEWRAGNENQTTQLPGVSAAYVRHERTAWNICQHRIYCGDMALQLGTTARELKPTAAYRLGVDKGGG